MRYRLTITYPPPGHKLDNKGTETLNEKQVHFDEVMYYPGTGQINVQELTYLRKLRT